MKFDLKNRYLKSFGLIVLFMGIIYGCSDNSVSPIPPDGNGGEPTDTTNQEPPRGGNTFNYHSGHPYQVNVIYFVPKNVEPNPNWRSRISGFMLYYQDYYRKWMKHWGYGNKTFGLLVDDTGDDKIVKITKIKGNHPSFYYPNHTNSGPVGGQRIRKEVRQYFRSHSEAEVNSKSWIVYTPKVPRDLRPQSGFPYYTIGRWAFVRDRGQKPPNAEHIGGGDAHELGHALGLIHNAEPLPQRDKLGNALMHNGNRVWNGSRPSFHHNGKGAKHTSLTEFDTAILNVSQPFSEVSGFFYSPVHDKLLEASGSHTKSLIKVSGRYSTDVPVTSIFILLDPPKQGGYNRYAFKGNINGGGRFQVTIDKKRLILNDNQHYGMSLWLIHRNGSKRHFSLPDFSFDNGIPKVNFHLGPVNTLPKTNWEVINFSDQATASNKLARNIIDGDFGTWWHSAFVGGNAPHPHSLTVDMGKQITVEGFQFVQAPHSKWRSRIKRMDIKISGDNVHWTSLGEFHLANTHLPQQIKLDRKRKFRYFKILTRESWRSSDWNASSLAEVGVF